MYAKCSDVTSVLRCFQTMAPAKNVVCSATHDGVLPDATKPDDDGMDAPYPPVRQASCSKPPAGELRAFAKRLDIA